MSHVRLIQMMRVLLRMVSMSHVRLIQMMRVLLRMV